MLPDLIEITPLAQMPDAVIAVPGSKSITNRALILAALADKPVTLRGALWSEDTQIMAEALQALGFAVEIKPDEHEPCNRTIRIGGLGGEFPPAARSAATVDLFVGNAGTAARFLAAFACLGHQTYRLQGTERMQQRPQSALFTALRQLGYVIDAKKDRLPATIQGAGPRAGTCRVATGESSQFASALLLCAARGKWQPHIADENGEEGAYITMTRRLIDTFPHGGGEFQIEPDASSASYFHAAGFLLSGNLQVNPSPKTDWQIDAAFPRFLPLPHLISRRSDLGDSIMTAMILAPFAPEPVEFSELGRLRVQECERVQAMRTELSHCGAKVVEKDDTLTIYPSQESMHGAEIETYNDHRMAMCFAILGLKIPGIKLKYPECVRKTFPNFFQKLAAPAPGGLGVVLRHGRTGEVLNPDQLFAG